MDERRRVCTTCGARYDDRSDFCRADGTALRPSTSGALPVVGRYELAEHLGGGGASDVYRARDPATDRTFAVKVLRLSGDPAAATRLLAEARAIGRLSHPNVVVLHEAGMLPDGRAYLVLDLVDGQPLSTVLARRAGPLALPEALDVGIAIAGALGAAHAQGILHRDVKPENVLVPRRGASDDFAASRLADFGVQGMLTDVGRQGERLTSSGVVAGTPAYMSPEQLLGARNSPATDLFGLGAVLYEMLVGARPQASPSAQALLVRRLGESITVPDDVAMPAALRALLERLLDREPGHRPQDASEVLAQLRRLRATAGSWDEAHRSAPPARAVARSAPAVAVPDGAAEGAPAGRRTSIALGAAALAIAAVVLLRARSGSADLPSIPPPPPTGALSPLVLLQPVAVVLVGVLLFAVVTRLVDRRRAMLVAETADVHRSVDSALLGGMPLDRDAVSRTIVTTVEAIIARCEALDERLIGQTIVAIAREYASDASTPDSRMAALVQIPQQLEKLSQRIAAHSTPWYVRHEKLLAVTVSGTTVIGGLTKTVLDIAAAMTKGAAPTH